MRLRRIASLTLTIAVVAAAPTFAGCGASSPHRRAGAPGKIEALREAQEKAQSQIESEGRRHAREAAREQQAARAQAEGERDDRTGPAR
jgi:hypothetical protein